MSEWVSVKDRFPPVNENGYSDHVLLYAPTGTAMDEIAIGWWQKQDGWGVENEDLSFAFAGRNLPVTHWMPLPTAPQ